MSRLVLVVSLALSAVPALGKDVSRSIEPSVAPAEGVRMRGGFSFNGGGGLGAASGGTASVAARIGAQFNRWFSTYYQAQPILFVAGNESGVAAGLVFANSLLANFTLADFFDLGVGPSLDYSAIAGCNAGFDCDAARGFELGLHGRAAINLGSRNTTTGSRSGFSIGLDVHPMFTPAGTVFLAMLGIGGEWF